MSFEKTMSAFISMKGQEFYESSFGGDMTMEDFTFVSEVFAETFGKVSAEVKKEIEDGVMNYAVEMNSSVASSMSSKPKSYCS